MSNIIRTAGTMAKPELIAHLEREHSQAVTRPLVAHRWTKTELTETHRLIHLGLGASAAHEHRTPPWLSR